MRKRHWACLILMHLFLLFFSLSLFAETRKKISLHAQMALINALSIEEPTTQSFQRAREVFQSYKNQIDPGAYELLPNGQVEENVLLYIHSFTQGPHEIQVFADLFRELNFNVVALSFSGHELDENQQRRLNFRDYDESDWQRDVEFAMQIARQYGKKVWVMGYSTGGLLALQQVLSDSSRVHALLLAAPAFALQQDFAGLSCTGSFLVNNGLEFLTDSHEKITVEGACLIRNTISQIFERTTLPSPLVTVAVFRNISVPTLLLYTERDEVVDNWRTELWSESADNPIQLFRLGESDHATHGDILTGYNIDLPMSRYDGQSIRQAVSQFIQDHL